VHRERRAVPDVEPGEVVGVRTDRPVGSLEVEVAAADGVLDGRDEDGIDLDRGQRDDVVLLVAHGRTPLSTHLDAAEPHRLLPTSMP
jgi:hypothetical protein